MDEATFYRGISVAESDFVRVVDDIRNSGITQFRGLSARQNISFRPLQSASPAMLTGAGLGALLKEPELVPAVYASCDRKTADWYAIRHNRTAARSKPLVISFRASLDDAIVDGNDLLFRAFSAPAKHRPELREILVEHLYGRALDPYLKAAWLSDDAEFRIQCCELALQDRDVVRHHRLNQIHVVAGVRFASAFRVRLPISPESLVSIEEPTEGDWGGAYHVAALLSS